MASFLSPEFWRELLGIPTYFHLDPDALTVNVPVILEHDQTQIYTNFALDTGSSFVVIRPSLLTALGLTVTGKKTEVTTASGIETATLITLPKISSFWLLLV